MKTLVLDFDDTLFNTRAFKKEFFQHFETTLQISTADVQAVYDLAKQSGFTHERFIELLAQEHANFSVSDAHQYFESLLLDTSRFVFPDVVPFLEWIRNASNIEKFQVILLTYGSQEFQSAKIAGSKIANYFERIIVTMDTKAKAASDIFTSEGVVYVDDTADHLRDVALNYPHVTLFAIDRHATSIHPDIMNEYPTVSRLDALQDKLPLIT